MANALGIDMGQVYSTVERLKGAKQEREQNKLLFDQGQEDRKQQQESLRTKRQRRKTLNALRMNAMEGSDEAMTSLVALAPEEAKQFQEAVAKMDEREKARTQERIETVGRMAAAVKTSDNPEQTYQRVRSNVSDEVRGRLPEQYDPGFIEVSLARVREMDDIMEGVYGTPEKVSFGGQDRLYRDGKEVERTKSQAAMEFDVEQEAKAADMDPRMEPADSNAIYRQAAGMYGDVDPQTGKVSAMKNDRPKIQALAERASQLYADGTARTHAKAVAIASRELKVPTPNLAIGSTVKGQDLLDLYPPD